MSKVVILIDGSSDDAVLTVTKKMLETFFDKVIVKRMPEKKHYKKNVDMPYQLFEMSGYNSCVDELESEEE